MIDNVSIKMHRYIYENIVKHANSRPKLEVGGYLFGYKRVSEEKIEFIVTDIYMSNKIGTDCKFTFTTAMKLDALNYLRSQISNNRKIQLLGTYHSHGMYEAIPSDEDREVGKSFNNDSITVIYSPTTKNMYGEVTFKDKSFRIGRVTTFDKLLSDDDIIRR